MQDCFAYRNQKCLVLKIKECDGCGFYKTLEQYQADRAKALERIYSLDEDRQKEIFETYHLKDEREIL